MSDLPTLSIGESPSKFKRSQEDNVIKSKTDGGYEFRRRRFTRKPVYMFTTGYIGISQTEKEMIETFWNDKLTDTAFLYTDIINGGVFNVTFDKPPTFTYKGIGTTRLWDVTLEMRQV